MSLGKFMSCSGFGRSASVSLAILPLLAFVIPQAAHGTDSCLSDETIEQALGEQVRSGAFLVDTRTLPVLPLCSGLTLAQQLQRMHDRAFPSEPSSRPGVSRPAVDEQGLEERVAKVPEVSGRVALEGTGARAAVRTAPRRRAPAVAPRRAPARAARLADAFYPNCRAVRAAGAAPIMRGESGYSRKLDRDGDGIACE